MTSRRFRIALLILVVCVVPLISEAGNPSSSFAVRIEGHGAPMLLIPGFTSSGAVWDDVVAAPGARIALLLAVRSLQASPFVSAGPVDALMLVEIVGECPWADTHEPCGFALGG